MSYNKFVPFCPINRVEKIDNTYDCVAKTFILPERNITFQSNRDKNNPDYFFVLQKDIYQSGKIVQKTMYLTEYELNKLFYSLNNLDLNVPRMKIMYTS